MLVRRYYIWVKTVIVTLDDVKKIAEGKGRPLAGIGANRLD